MSDTAPLSARARLRGLTQSSHQRLDQVWAGLDLSDRASYGRFLQANAAALLPMEAALERRDIGALVDDWDLRRRSPAILADLDGLGLSSPADASGLPAVDPADGAGLLGVLYVLEGSRLGAALLLRQTEAAADEVVRENRRYLRHGQGGRLWPSFVARLEAQGWSDAQTAQAVAGAKAAFAAFEAAAGMAGG